MIRPRGRPSRAAGPARGRPRTRPLPRSRYCVVGAGTNGRCDDRLPCDVAWSAPFPRSARDPGDGGARHRHPPASVDAARGLTKGDVGLCRRGLRRRERTVSPLPGPREASAPALRGSFGATGSDADRIQTFRRGRDQIGWPADLSMLLHKGIECGKNTLKNHGGDPGGIRTRVCGPSRAFIVRSVGYVILPKPLGSRDRIRAGSELGWEPA